VTFRDGTPAETCSDWTVVDNMVNGRLGASTSREWLDLDGTAPCGGARPLLCLGITKQAPLVSRTFTGKRFWQSAPLAIGTQSPDQACQASAPSGVASAIAFIGYTGQPAFQLLDPDATYVRADGALIGTGQNIGDGLLETGPWMTDTGALALDFVWTGGPPNEAPTAAQTCNDWTTTAANGIVGDPASVLAFQNTQPRCDAAARRVYCIER